MPPTRAWKRLWAGLMAHLGAPATARSTASVGRPYGGQRACQLVADERLEPYIIVRDRQGNDLGNVQMEGAEDVA
jgi:hypothetical protein